MSKHRLPVLSSINLRPMHLRGIENCIKAGMFDLDEIAVASGLNEASDIEPVITKVQKMNMAKSKKKVKKKAPKED